MQKRPQDILVQAGLSEYEAGIYTAMLGAGPLSISQIVRSSVLHRPAVYSALPSLVSKGLVSTTLTGKRVQYVAEEPELLEKLFLERERQFKETLSEFSLTYHKKKTKPSIKMLVGKEGLRSVLTDLAHTMKAGETFYRASSRDLGTDVERFVPKEFRGLRDAKKLEQLVITNSALKSSSHKKRIECFSKMIPPSEDPFTYDIATLIYGSKVAYVDYKEETALIIDNPRFAKFQERLFRSLFKRL